MSSKLCVYRARIPVDPSALEAEKKATARRDLDVALKTDSQLQNADATALSVAVEANGRYATVLFRADAAKLPDDFPLRTQGRPSLLQADRHFDGITTVASPEVTNIVFVVVPGLAGHPYGSFKERGGSLMWIVDHLPKILPHARIILYGYKSEIVHGHVHLRVSELGRMLRTVLELKENMIQDTPYMFIAHSLGGLVLKHALLSSCRDRSWLSHVTHGGVFLGVPNLGMKQDHLVTLVEGDPAKELVANLAENSELLMQLNVDFEKHFNFENTEIFSFYETAETPVLRMDGDRPISTGRFEYLVSRESATRCRYQDYQQGRNHGLPRNHSELVKFRPFEDGGHLGIVTKELERMSIDAMKKKPGQAGRAASPASSLARSPTRSRYPRSPLTTSALSQEPLTYQGFSFHHQSFIERHDLCRTLSSTCTTRDPSQSGRTALKGGLLVIHGMRGCGKSMLVKWFVETHKAMDCWEYIFFVDAATRLGLENDIAAIAGLLGWETSHLKFDHLLARFISWQKTTRRWLLVFENADSEVIRLGGAATSQSYFFTKGNVDDGLVIVVQNSAPNIILTMAPIEVDQMTTDEAMQLMQMGTRGSDIPEKDLQRLVEEVGCHPLTIEGILGYMNKNKFTNPSRKALDFIRSLRHPSASGKFTDRVLARSWDVFEEVFKRLESLATNVRHSDAESAQNALSLMEFLAFSDRRGFHVRIFWLSWNKIRKSKCSEWRRQRHLKPFQASSNLDDVAIEVEEALVMLHDYHLIIWHENEGIIEIHPIVQMAARKRPFLHVADHSRPPPWEIALTTLSEAISWDHISTDSIHDGNPRKDRWIVHTHLLSWLGPEDRKQWFTNPGDSLLDRAEIGLKISIAMGEGGKLEIALQLQREICRAIQSLLSTEAEDRSEIALLYYRALNELGISMREIGHTQESVELRERICEEVAHSSLEFDQRDILAWKTNLANGYFDLFLWEEAYDIRRDVLQAYRDVDDPLKSVIPIIYAHLDFADSLETIGRTPEALHHRHLAIAKYTEIVSTDSKDWDPMDASGLLRLVESNRTPSRLGLALLRGIAKSFHQFGRYIEALAIREKLLDWHKSDFHDSHPQLLDAYTECANTKERLKQDVIDLRQHVFKKTQSIFGKHHPRTIATRLALDESRVLSEPDSSGLDDAFEILQELESQRPIDQARVLYVKDRISQLKLFSEFRDDHQEALSMQKEIFEARQSLGLKDRYDTLMNQLRIGDCLSQLHHHIDALIIHQKALESQYRFLELYGPDMRETNIHPLTVHTKALMAKDYLKLADPLCSCFEPGDACNNILPPPVRQPAMEEVSGAPSPPLGRPASDMSSSGDLPKDLFNVNSELLSSDEGDSDSLTEWKNPLDGRHIDMTRTEIDAIKSERLRRAIELAREVLSIRTEIFTEKHKLTIESMDFLAEVLDFESPFLHGEEVDNLEARIDELKKEMNGITISDAEPDDSFKSYSQVTKWLDSLDTDFNASSSSIAVWEPTSRLQRSVSEGFQANSSLFGDQSEGQAEWKGQKRKGTV